MFRLATFVVGRDLFAIDIMRIREIVRPMEVTAVPRAPSGMIGVMDLRGQVLPLFDVRQRFGMPARQGDEQHLARYLIVTLDGRLLGLVVDQVHDVVSVQRRDLRVGGNVLAGEAAEVFIGVVPVGDRLALLLNLRRLLTTADRLALDALLGRKDTP
jgi:purine-binding chemotaxis protein CheW